MVEIATKHSVHALLALLLVSSPCATKQVMAADTTTYAKNLVYVELGGNDGFFSVGYDRYIIPNLLLKCGVGWSIQFRDTMVEGRNVFDYPPGFHVVPAYVFDLGKEAQCDAGAGLYHNLSIDNPEGIPFDDLRGRSLLTTLLGIRLSNAQGGFVFRFTLVGFSDLLAYRVLFGLDFGYRL